MRRLASAAVMIIMLLLVFWLWRAPAYAAPYVSCPGGYIAPEIGDCPNIPQNRGGKREPTPHGGNPGGGLIGDLLGRLGLGGLL